MVWKLFCSIHRCSQTFHPIYIDPLVSNSSSLPLSIRCFTLIRCCHLPSVALSSPSPYTPTTITQQPCAAHSHQPSNHHSATASAAKRPPSTPLHPNAATPMPPHRLPRSFRSALSPDNSTINTQQPPQGAPSQQPNNHHSATAAKRSAKHGARFSPLSA